MLRFSVLAGVSGALAQADCADGDEVCLLQTNVQNHYAMGAKSACEDSPWLGSIDATKYPDLAEAVDACEFDEVFETFFGSDEQDRPNTHGPAQFLADYLEEMECAEDDNGEEFCAADMFAEGEDGASWLFYEALVAASEDLYDEYQENAPQVLLQVAQSGAIDPNSVPLDVSFTTKSRFHVVAMPRLEHPQFERQIPLPSPHASWSTRTFRPIRPVSPSNTYTLGQRDAAWASEINSVGKIQSAQADALTLNLQRRNSFGDYSPIGSIGFGASGPTATWPIQVKPFDYKRNHFSFFQLCHSQRGGSDFYTAPKRGLSMLSMGSGRSFGMVTDPRLTQAMMERMDEQTEMMQRMQMTSNSRYQAYIKNYDSLTAPLPSGPQYR